MYNINIAVAIRVVLLVYRYLYNTYGLILLFVLFVVSRIVILCYIIRHV